MGSIDTPKHDSVFLNDIVTNSYDSINDSVAYTDHTIMDVLW